MRLFGETDEFHASVQRRRSVADEARRPVGRVRARPSRDGEPIERLAEALSSRSA